jgi:hypothetical protein
MLRASGGIVHGFRSGWWRALHAVRLHCIIVDIAGRAMRAHRDEETATRCKHSESAVFIPASPLQRTVATSITVATHCCNAVLQRAAVAF